MRKCIRSDMLQVVTTSLRVSETTRARASRLAASSGSSIGDVVERALDTYERALFWEQTRRALQAPGGVEDDGDRAWDATARDGLERA